MTSPKHRLSALALASLTLVAAAGCSSEASSPTSSAQDASDAGSSDASSDTISDTASSDAVTSLADAATSDTSAAAVGSPCKAPGDCGTGLFCLIAAGGSAGSCVAFHSEGETCMIDAIPCASGLICTNGAVCYKPKTDAAEGASCHYDKCAADLLCVGAPQVASCQAKGAEGAPCTGGSPDGCKAGLICGADKKCVKA